MYAILDIETTGGKYNEEGITEIAIYKFDGHKIIDQFISLVNPERPIQAFVEKLTGINSKMLTNAPKFYEVAKRIVEITEDCILVAHNADFDYRMLRTEFKRLGFNYKKDSICTVELSKKLLPEQPSHSLGKLVRSLGIPMSDRHRASGDALATVELFKLLLNKDLEKKIVQQTVRNLDHKFNDKLNDIVRDLPNAVGVYFMHDKEGNIIYVGKSKDIKKRVNQHFTNNSKKGKSIQKEVDQVTFEITGSEMIALLIENDKIKRIKPKYNHALKKSIFSYALYPITNDKGYITLKVLKSDGRKKHITSFTNYQNGKKFLNRITDEYGLCEKFTGVYTGKNSCFKYEIQECAGACIDKESFNDYNQRIRSIIEKYSFVNKSMLITDVGRQNNEKSFVLIKDSQFLGYGYYNLNHQISKQEIIESITIKMDDNRDARHIIQSQLRRSKKLKIQSLPN